MCYYCRYLANDKSIALTAENDYYRANVKYQTARASHLPTLIRLLALTCFFVILNLTIVLSQSSQLQQQNDQSKLLEKNSQGTEKEKLKKPSFPNVYLNNEKSKFLSFFFLHRSYLIRIINIKYKFSACLFSFFSNDHLVERLTSFPSAALKCVISGSIFIFFNKTKD